MSIERGATLPSSIHIEGSLPQFGVGIETKIRSSGLRAGPYTLIFADAVVPVSKRVPVTTFDEMGKETPVLRMSEKGVMEEEMTMDVSHQEPVTVLLGLGHYSTTFTNGASHDRIVSYPYLHVERTYTNTRQESRYSVKTIQETNTLLMEKGGRIVRFHTVENELTVPIDGIGVHTLEYKVGIMEHREEGADPQYTLARVMFERDGSEIKKYRVEEAAPFERI